ncbi:hypothetical protein [Neptuniibacter sp. QD37_11]|uniref:hypothetical protein n=1 Tax=Neptuniibacter sp. QD37_11 TaxID=3398209 RepID=UPI0039F4B3F0
MKTITPSEIYLSKRNMVAMVFDESIDIFDSMVSLKGNEVIFSGRNGQLKIDINNRQFANAMRAKEKFYIFEPSSIGNAVLCEFDNIH